MNHFIQWLARIRGRLLALRFSIVEGHAAVTETYTDEVLARLRDLVR